MAACSAFTGELFADTMTLVQKLRRLGEPLAVSGAGQTNVRVAARPSEVERAPP